LARYAVRTCWRRRLTMKRSQVNAIIEQASSLFAMRGIALPPFSNWSCSEWQRRGSATLPMIRSRLGWDVVEWESGRFATDGLVLFTLRNKRTEDTTGYAEKVMLIRRGQHTPLHTHRTKTEDIINRGGGELVVTLGPLPEGASKIDLCVNGMARALSSGAALRLSPGESVTLEPGVFHAFHAEEDDVIGGEVSTFNDDTCDNLFLRETARFPTIEEDEPPRWLLVNDYDSRLGWV